jgi:hypothetical protein
VSLLDLLIDVDVRPTYLCNLLILPRDLLHQFLYLLLEGTTPLQGLLEILL